MNQTKLGNDQTVYQEKCFFCEQELKDPDYINGGSESGYAVCSMHEGVREKIYLVFRPALFVLGLFLVLPAVLLAYVYYEAKELL